MNITDALYDGIKNMLTYLPKIYTQRPSSQTFNGEITIRYPYQEVPNNALLFVLPMYNSLESNNKLVIQYATVSLYKEISYENTKEYDILIEDQNGLTRNATRGDIVANKLCMFRFLSNNSNAVILCNNPIYNNIQCSSLNITNEAVFNRIPVYKRTEKINGVPTEVESELVYKDLLDDVITRLEKLEQKIHIGTKSPEEFFNDNKNLPDGTLYFQTEE